MLPAGLKTIGDYAFYNSLPTTSSSLTIPAAIDSIGSNAFGLNRNATIALAQPSSLQYLGDYAFSDADKLTEARIPQLKTMGQGAFSGCNALQTVQLPDDLTELPYGVFSGCEKLTSINLPSALTTIGNQVFYNCSLLTTLPLPASVRTIGERAFQYCYALTEITIPEGVTELPKEVLYDCNQLASVTLPSTLRTIGQQALSSCELLTALTLPSGVTTIGTSAFSYCSGLLQLDFPASVQSIGASALSGCSALQSVTLPQDLTVLPSSLFSGCSSLRHVTLPPGVQQLPSSLFYNCSRLETITLPTTSITSIPDRFCDGCTSLQAFTMPASVTSIGYRAFYGCASLTQVVLPLGLTTIGGYAYHSCTSLQQLSLPEGLATLGDYAFSGCTSLTSVALPQSVKVLPICLFRDCTSLQTVSTAADLTTINSSCFSGCKSLQAFTIPATVTTLGGYAFSGCEQLQSIALPEGLTTVPSYLCSECSRLSSVSLPSSITVIDNGAFVRCGSLQQVQLPQGLTTLESSCFSNSGLTSIDLPASLREINGAFTGCNSLTTVWVPEGVTRVSSAFEYCKNLRSVYLPSTLTSNSYANFVSCSRLTEVHIKAETAPSTQYSFDYGVSTATLYVPAGHLADFQDKPFGRGWKAVVEEDLTVAALDDAEWQVLKRLPAATGGDHWQRPWTLAETAAQQTATPYGVTVAGGHVVALSLTSNNLQGPLPTELLQLPYLQSLDLSGNQLTGDLTELFSEVGATTGYNSTLTYLDVSNNQLTGNLYHLAQPLSALTTLKACGNRIRDIWPVLPTRITTLEFEGQDLRSQFALNYSELYKLRGDVMSPELLPTVLTYHHYVSSSGSYYNNTTDFFLTDTDPDGSTAPTWYARLEWDWRTNYTSSMLSHTNSNSYNGWYQLPLNTTVTACRRDYYSADNKYHNTRFLVTIDSEMGDVNFDTKISLADMQTTLYYALDSAYNSRYQPFNFTAANLVSTDQVINVQDVVASINLLLDNYIQPTIAGSRRRAEAVASGGAAAEPVATLSMEQGRLVLRTEAEVGAIELAFAGGDDAEWQPALQLFSRASRGGHHIFYSLLGDRLPAGEWVLATTQGQLVDATLASPDGQELPIAILSDGTTAVGEPAIPSQATKADSYDLQGRRVAQPRQKGIYLTPGGKKLIVK